MVSSKRVVLAMSGGVDSSVAAMLLQQQGYEVIGVFMRHGEESAAACKLSDGKPNPLLPILQGRADHKQGCCSASDAADARKVADRLNIPFYALDLQADFKRIVDYFVDEYQHGRTPNPCVQCNNWLKFGRLFDYADSVDAHFVATGHYARLLPTDDGIGLFRGIDDDKDQSYVLAGISRTLLPRMMLPIGGYRKSEIRALASEVGLRVADKKDSQEICFVTSGHHGEFVRSKSGINTAGEIVTTSGRVVGQHDGIEQFTIGQRKGIGVAMGEPYFVVRIEPKTARVVIGKKEELGVDTLTARRTNWLVERSAGTFEAAVQIRYNSTAQPAQVTVPAAPKQDKATLGAQNEKNPGKSLQPDSFAVRFHSPCYGVAPGQLAVVFEGDRVLGGGWID
ncbi:MAG: tRNA 2-thiouridine(34) synthase MnmA [Planctomycetaceae bacterium]|nr:tRNA 2-thiouridine(34) synthase MnmA [Planctomycetaceae bacterium]